MLSSGKQLTASSISYGNTDISHRIRRECEANGQVDKGKKQPAL